MGQLWSSKKACCGTAGEPPRDDDCLILRAAACTGDTARIAALLGGGIDVDRCVHPNGSTSLHAAALMGQITAASLLLDSGANVRARNNRGETALLLAAQRGDPAMVALFVAAGADINAVDDGGETALLGATRRGDVAIIATLLQAGASVDVRDARGHSPSFHAIAFGFVDALKLLLAAGADVSSPCWFSESEPSTPGTTCLLAWAASIGNTAAVRALLDAGANPDGNGVPPSPLARAVVKGTHDTVNALLLGGACADGAKDFAPPLILAVSEKDARTVTLLLAFNASISKRGDAGFDAVDVAKAAGNHDIVRLLECVQAARSAPRSACVVCLVSDAAVAFVPCGHRALCPPCDAAHTFARCPCCRAAAEQTLRVYD